MNRTRDARGALQLAFGIAVTMILLGVALAPSIIQDIVDATNGRWNPKEHTGFGSAGQQVRIPFVGPALPSDEQQSACVMRIASENGLTWTGQGRGWRAPGTFPEPELTGDAATDRGKVAVWLQGIVPYVQDTAEKWKSCEQAPSSTSTSSTPDEEPDIPGTYQFTYGATNTECSRPNEKVAVSTNGNNVSLTGTFGTVTSALTTDFAFDGSVPSDIGAGVRLRGRFARFGSKTVIRGGVLELQVGGGCSVPYDGERTGN
jgi:hypothetical protein